MRPLRCATLLTKHVIFSAAQADLTDEPAAETDKTIKSKASGPDFSKLADEISAAFNKIFSKGK